MYTSNNFPGFTWLSSLSEFKTKNVNFKHIIRHTVSSNSFPWKSHFHTECPQIPIFWIKFNPLAHLLQVFQTSRTVQSRISTFVAHYLRTYRLSKFLLESTRLPCRLHLSVLCAFYKNQDFSVRHFSYRSGGDNTIITVQFGYAVKGSNSCLTKTGLVQGTILRSQRSTAASTVTEVVFVTSVVLGSPVCWYYAAWYQL